MIGKIKRNYCVYMHRNKINNKKYIGITGGIPEKRWNNGNGYKYNSHFYFAIKKYGWEEGFEHIVLDKNLTKREAEQREIAIISFYNTTDQNKGYNIAIGGGVYESKKVYQYDRHTGKFIDIWENTISIEKKLKIPNTHISAICLGKMKTSHGFFFSYIYLGEFLPNEIYQKINTDDCVRKIAQYDLEGKFLNEYSSLTLANKSVKSNINMNGFTSHGYIWKYIDESNDYKNNLSQEELDSRLNRPDINAKECYQYTLNGKFIRSFESTTKAAKSINCGQSNIAATCRKETANSSGYIWRFADKYEYGKDLDEKDYKRIHKSSKGVSQYSLDGEYIQNFENITKAANYIGCSTNEISKVCLRKNKTSHGYIWRYSNECLKEDELKKINTHNRKKKVAQYDMNMNYIQFFESIAEAERKTGACGSSIQLCCIGKHKHAKNYKWKYV